MTSVTLALLRRRLFIAITVFALVAVPSALTRSSVLAQAHITTSGGTTYKLTIENNSQDLKSIHCIQYIAPSGTTITTVTAPTGWSSTGANPSTFGFRQDNPGITVGGTLSIDFTTQAPVTAESVVHYSSDCIEDLVTTVRPPTTVSPPPPPPPPPPPKKKKPCKCAKLDVKLDPTLLNKKLRPDKHDFGVGITWFLTCTKGKGGCSATIHFLPPAVFAGSVPVQDSGLKLNLKKTTIVCAGPCGKSTTGRFQIEMLSHDQLNKLFGRTLAYTIVSKCNKKIKTIKVKVFVDSKGVLKPAA